jgi:hypothetical protein
VSIEQVRAPTNPPIDTSCLLCLVHDCGLVK